GQWQPRPHIGYETPVETVQALLQLRLRIRSHRPRNRLHAVDMQDYRVRQSRVHGRLDRGTQSGRIGLGDDELSAALAGGIISVQRPEKRTQSHADHDGSFTRL